MTSLSSSERAESLFLLYEQPPANLQRCESFDGIKSMNLFKKHFINFENRQFFPQKKKIK